MIRFKNALIDIAATVMIVVAVTTGLEWAQWLVWIYTPLMLALKLLGLVANIPIKRTEADVPAWFYHLLYGANVAALLGFGWWMTGAQWVAIWALSAATAWRARPRMKTT